MIYHTYVLQLISTLYKQWYSGPVGCALVYALRDVGFVASSLTLSLLGVERLVNQVDQA